jgi:hypothetical protein
MNSTFCSCVMLRLSRSRDQQVVGGGRGSVVLRNNPQDLLHQANRCTCYDPEIRYLRCFRPLNAGLVPIAVTLASKPYGSIAQCKCVCGKLREMTAFPVVPSGATGAIVAVARVGNDSRIKQRLYGTRDILLRVATDMPTGGNVAIAPGKTNARMERDAEDVRRSQACSLAAEA